MRTASRSTVFSAFAKRMLEPEKVEDRETERKKGSGGCLTTTSEWPEALTTIEKKRGEAWRAAKPGEMELRGRIMDWRVQWGSLCADRQLCWLQFSKCTQAVFTTQLKFRRENERNSGWVLNTLSQINLLFFSVGMCRLLLKCNLKYAK